MVQLIVGKKGKGKTKQLLDKVNSRYDYQPFLQRSFQSGLYSVKDRTIL